MVLIDLMAMRDEVVESAIHWAKTNKDYMTLRDNYVYFITTISHRTVYSQEDPLGKIFRNRTPDNIAKLAAPSLTVAQQRKLRAVLDKLTVLLPELNPRKQHKAEASAQQDTDTNTK